MQAPGTQLGLASEPLEGIASSVPMRDDAPGQTPKPKRPPPRPAGLGATCPAIDDQMDMSSLGHMGLEGVDGLMDSARHWVHELRNPLTAVIGGLAVALKPPPGLDPARQEALLAGALASARLADAWVQDMGDWCRVQGGEALPVGQALRLQEVVQEAVAHLAPVAAAKGVVVSWSPPEAGVLVHGDAARFERVVMALLHRAIRVAKGPVVVEAMDGGGPGLLVRPGLLAGDPQLAHAQAVAAAHGGSLAWTPEAFVWRMAPASA